MLRENLKAWKESSTKFWHNQVWKGHFLQVPIFPRLNFGQRILKSEKQVEFCSKYIKVRSFLTSALKIVQIQNWELSFTPSPPLPPLSPLTLLHIRDKSSDIFSFAYFHRSTPLYLSIFSSYLWQELWHIFLCIFPY